MIELYGREEFLGRYYAKDSPIIGNSNQKPLFMLAVICSPFYNDFEKVKACIKHNLKNKLLTHEVRVYFNFSLLNQELINEFKNWCELNNFEYCLTVVSVNDIDNIKELSNSALSGANAVITFDSSDDNSYVIKSAKDYAGMHKLMIKSY